MLEDRMKDIKELKENVIDPKIQDIKEKLNDKKRNRWLVGFIFFAILFLVLNILFALNKLDFWEEQKSIIRKLSFTAFFIFLTLFVSKFIEKLISMKVESKGDRHNFIRLIRFITGFICVFFVVGLLFQNLYTTAISLGLFSLILGFALQAPISSLIGWTYLIIRRPYKLGDRIQIGISKGDVISIGYFDTSIMEVSGVYLDNDRRSGRVITFPNSKVFTVEVFNYAGPSYPFIWNEAQIHINYDSDVEFVQQCLLKAAQQDFIQRYPDVDLQKKPKLQPSIYFNVTRYGWLIAYVSYPVKPEDTTVRRTEILKTALKEINSEPGRDIVFPRKIEPKQES